MPKVLNPQRKLPRPDDPELLDSITESQRHGYSTRVTASNAQIAKVTLAQWLQEGRAQLAAYDAGETTELGSHGRFAYQYERAASERESVLTDAITASITDKSVAFVPALISLKARNPADWLEARQVNVHTEVTGLIAHVSLPSLPEQQLLALVQDKLQSGQKLLPPPPP